MDKELVEMLIMHLQNYIRSTMGDTRKAYVRCVENFLDKEGYVILKKDRLVKVVGHIKAEELLEEEK